MCVCGGGAPEGVFAWGAKQARTGTVYRCYFLGLLNANRQIFIFIFTLETESTALFCLWLFLDNFQTLAHC